jgi:hypothetical protein
MLQPPTTETKERTEASRTPAGPMPQPTLHPRHAAKGALDAAPRIGSQSYTARLDEHIFGLQRTVGNQAVLRMLGRSGEPQSRIAPLGVGLILQRKCACGGSATECESCKEKQEQGTLQRRATGVSAAGEAPPIVHQVLRSPGQPLEPGARRFFEPRFGHDFSQVRIHADETAAKSARAVDALAYAVKHHVVFGTGQYAPGSSAGQRLLAHELTHVVQQSTRGFSGSSVSIEDSPQAESEADGTADKVLSAGLLGFHSANPSWGLQRAPAPSSSNVDSMPLEEAVRNIPSLSQDDALKVLKRFQAFILTRISTGEGRIRQLISLRAESFSNYLIGGTIEIFGLTSLPSDNWEKPWKHVTDAYGTIARRQVPESLGHLLGAARATNEEWALLNDYLEKTEKGADRSIFVLQALEVAGAAAATALTGGGAAAVVVGAGYAGAQRLAGEATSTYIGLQQEIDWGGVLFDTLFAAVAGRFGGQLGKSIAARIGGKIAGPLVSSLIVGRASGIAHAVARELFDSLRGQTHLTVDGFIERLAEQLTLRAVFMDLVAHAAGTVAAQARSPQVEPPPARGGVRQFKLIRGGMSEGRVAPPSSVAPAEPIVPRFGAQMSAAPAIEPEPATTPAPRFKPYVVPTPAAEPVQAAAKTGAPTPTSNVQTGVAIAAATASPAPAEKQKCPHPTGLPDDPIPMIWFKPELGPWYPDSIEVAGRRYGREDPPTTLPHGEPIGVESEYWPQLGKLLRLDYLLPEEKNRPGSRRFKRVLESYGYDWSGLSPDHVQDLAWEGPDEPENLWPMSSDANSLAGTCQNSNQRVNFCPAKVGPPMNMSLQEMRNANYYSRWFAIREYRSPLGC